VGARRGARASRGWSREHARPRAGRTSFRAWESLKDAFGAHVVATEIPIGAEQEVSGVIDLVDM